MTYFVCSKPRCRHSQRIERVSPDDNGWRDCGPCPRHGDSMLVGHDPEDTGPLPSVGEIGNLGRHESWGSGKVVFGLPPGHPDRIVTSERQAMEVAAKHGIDFETGQFRSDAAKRRAEGNRRSRLRMARDRVSISPDTFGQKIPRG